MTATPIPRTLALILYGDMDLSTIDELPAGRIPIKTYAVDNSMRQRIEDWTKKIVSDGQQVYIVHPAVEESELANLLSATENYEKLSKPHLWNTNRFNSWENACKDQRASYA